MIFLVALELFLLGVVIGMPPDSTGRTFAFGLMAAVCGYAVGSARKDRHE